MIAAPAMYQALRVNEASTIGAHTNSNVKARLVAATISDVSRTETPAATRLLPNARPITPTGHAVQRCRKKKANGGACFFTIMGQPVLRRSNCWWRRGKWRQSCSRDSRKASPLGNG